MNFKIYNMDVFEGLKRIEKHSIDCVVTSPPYWGLRDYGVEGQLGLEKHPNEYIENLVKVFRETKKVMKDSGSLWLNLGDSYFNYRPGAADKFGTSFERSQEGYVESEHRQREAKNRKLKPEKGWLTEKQKLLMPHRVAIAMQEGGWILRNDIVWHKPSHMPSSVQDRLTNSFEYLFHFVKKKKYYYDLDAIREPHQDATLERNNYARNGNKLDFDRKWIGQPDVEAGSLNVKGKNPGDMWSINPEGFSEAHFACFPTKLVRKPLKATCPKDGVILDPFVGSGTTLLEAQNQGKSGIGIELNPDYISLIKLRLNGDRFQESLNPNKIKVISMKVI